MRGETFYFHHSLWEESRNVKWVKQSWNAEQSKPQEKFEMVGQSQKKLKCPEKVEMLKWSQYVGRKSGNVGNSGNVERSQHD